MALQAQPTHATIIPALIAHPAQLFIGSDTAVFEYTQQLLQTYFCSNNSCNTCNTCLCIRNQQHHAIMWLYPEKNYTRQDLAIIFNTIALELSENSHFFFVIQKADTLSPACANSLLKSLEEPPRGYHFILLAQSLTALLPTIRSRCIIQTLYTEPTHTKHHALFSMFTTQTTPLFSDFLTALDQSKITEQESIELINALISYWGNQYKKALESNDTHNTQHAQRLLDHLYKALGKPPMPGSSKIFWKNLFLSVQLMPA